MIILSGRVSIKMAPIIRRIYDQMLEPKWVIAMGACASSAGMFNNYAVVAGRRQVPAGRRLRARLPAAPRGADLRDHQAAGQDHRATRRSAGASATRRRAPRRQLPDATGLELIAQRRPRAPSATTPSWAPTTPTSRRRSRSSPARVRDVLALPARRGRASRTSSSSASTASTTCPRSRGSASTTSCSRRARVERLDVKTRVTVEEPVVPQRRRPLPDRRTSRSARSTTCSASSSTATPTRAGS